LKFNSNLQIIRYYIYYNFVTYDFFNVTYKC